MKFSDTTENKSDLTRKDLVIQALWAAYDLLDKHKEDEAFSAFMLALKLSGLGVEERSE